MSGPWEKYASAAKPWERYQPDLTQDATGTFTENLAAGAGKALTDLGRGAKQLLDIPAQALERTFGEVKFGGLPTAKASAAATQAEIADSRKRDAPLMGTAGGLIGNVAGNVATTLLVPGGSYPAAVGSGAALGALQPTVEGESRVANTAIGAGAGAAGKFLGDKAASFLTNKLSAAEKAAESAALQNAPRDAALKAGREAGYVVPPTQANPSAVNRVLEGVSGKIQTGQVASQKNQKVTNELARKALGIEEDIPITKDVLNGIRKEAGQAYEALRGAGTITADKQYFTDLNKIMAKFEGASKDFPELAQNEIGGIVNAVKKEQFSADSAIDAISILRDKAAASAAKGDKSVASAFRSTAQAMEDAIERRLIESGDQELLKGFQAARKLIAKTYSVEGALNESGNVNAQALAKQLSKGKPLSDELRTAAEFAANFKKAAQNVDSMGSVPGVSPLDAAVGTLAGGPAGAAWFLGRPAVRSAILSKPYQNALAEPSYKVSDLLRFSKAAAEPVGKALPGGAAIGSLLQFQQ